MSLLSSAFKAALKPPKPMADGGVVTKPTVALIGEDGPEEVTPVDPEDVADGGADEETEAPAVDPRDVRISELEAQLAEANARSEMLGQTLFSARVEATDLLGDPSVMPYSPDLVDADDDALQAAVLALIANDPSLGKLSVTGDIDQGASDPPATPAVSLMNILKDQL